MSIFSLSRVSEENKRCIFFNNICWIDIAFNISSKTDFQSVNKTLWEMMFKKWFSQWEFNTWNWKLIKQGFHFSSSKVLIFGFVWSQTWWILNIDKLNSSLKVTKLSPKFALILFKETNQNHGVFNLIFFISFLCKEVDLDVKNIPNNLFLACIGQHYFSECKMHFGAPHNIANMFFIHYMV